MYSRIAVMAIHINNQMANERTILAWIRTGITFFILSITFLQFVTLSLKSNTAINIDGSKYDISSITSVTVPLFDKYARAIVSLCMVLGILSIFFGGFRYLTVQHMLIRHHFPISRIIIAVLVAVNLSMVILLTIFESQLIT